MRKLFNKDKRNFEGKHQTTSSPVTPAGPNEPAGVRNHHQYVCSPMLLSLHQSFTVRPLLLHALTRSPHSASLFCSLSDCSSLMAYW